MNRAFNHRLLRAAFVALLLFAQQTAFDHQVGHILDGTALQAQQSKSEQALHGGLCDFHVAFAGILGAVGSATHTPQFAQQKAEPHIADVAHAAPSAVIVPASRGPPVSLLS